MTTSEASLLSLGDRNRLLLLHLLLERPFSVGELTRITGLGQSLVSHHLAVLGRNGWVAGRRQGRRRIYRPAVLGSPLAPVAQWIKRQVDLPGSWQARGLGETMTDKDREAGRDLEDFLL